MQNSHTAWSRISSLVASFYPYLSALSTKINRFFRASCDNTILQTHLIFCGEASKNNASCEMLGMRLFVN